MNDQIRIILIIIVSVSIFGLLVNKNPGTRIYFSESNNQEFMRYIEYYYQNYPNNMINTIRDSDIVFILD